MKRIMVSIDIEDTAHDGNVIDGIYHLPEVISVVQMRFVPDKLGGMWHRDESSIRPNAHDKGDKEHNDDV